jgi:hypothetical protein
MSKMMRNYVIGLFIAIVIYAVAVSWMTIRDIIVPADLIDTIILFVLASATMFYAIRTSDIAKATEKQAGANVKMAEEMREQLKLNTFLALLRELSEGEARKNRDIVFTELDPNKPNLQAIKDSIIEDFTSKNHPEVRHIKDAAEETIARLDRVGFFLLRGDPNLKKEAPEWIWTITSQMWERAEWYVRHRKQSHKGYAKYFEELHGEARQRGFNG